MYSFIKVIYEYLTLFEEYLHIINKQERQYKYYPNCKCVSAVQ